MWRRVSRRHLRPAAIFGSLPRRDRDDQIARRLALDAHKTTRDLNFLALSWRKAVGDRSRGLYAPRSARKISRALRTQHHDAVAFDARVHHLQIVVLEQMGRKRVGGQVEREAVGEFLVARHN